MEAIMATASKIREKEIQNPEDPNVRDPKHAHELGGTLGMTAVGIPTAIAGGMAGIAAGAATGGAAFGGAVRLGGGAAAAGAAGGITVLVDVVLPAAAVPGTSTTAVHLGHLALRPANFASILNRAAQLSQRQMISPGIFQPHPARVYRQRK